MRFAITAPFIAAKANVNEVNVKARSAGRSHNDPTHQRSLRRRLTSRSDVKARSFGRSHNEWGRVACGAAPQHLHGPDSP